MKKKYLFLILFMIIPFISAYNAYLGEGLLLFSPLWLMLEILLFWILTKNLLNADVGFLKSIKIVLVANIPLALVGFLIPFPFDVVFASIPTLAFLLTPSILISLLITIILEFLVYTLFFIKKDVAKIRLLLISTIINFISYLVIALLYTSIALYCRTHSCINL